MSPSEMVWRVAFERRKQQRGGYARGIAERRVRYRLSDFGGGAIAERGGAAVNDLAQE